MQYTTQELDLEKHRTLLDRFRDNHQIGLTAALLEDSRSRGYPLMTDILGMRIRIDEGVFPPDLFYGALIFTPWVTERIRPGMRFCEMGCGTGLTSLGAARAGAEVTSVDINPAAIRNTKANAALNGLSLEIIKSDIFTNVPPGTFDIIYWNLPWGYTEDLPRDLLERSILDPGYEQMERFLKDARPRLEGDGEILMGIGSGADMDRFFQNVERARYACKRIHREDTMEVEPVIFEMYLLRPR